MISDRQHVLGNGIEYIPFRNVENENRDMSLVYCGDTQHYFRLVNDGDGAFHYELECLGPKRVRARLEEILPNMNRGNCVGTILTDISEQNLNKWKQVLREYFELHRGRIEVDYEIMRAEDTANLSNVWSFGK